MNNIDFIEFYTKYGSFMNQVPPSMYHALIEGFNYMLNNNMAYLQEPVFQQLPEWKIKQLEEEALNKTIEEFLRLLVFRFMVSIIYMNLPFGYIPAATQ